AGPAGTPGYSGNGGNASGGGLAVDSGTVKLTNVIFQDNQAQGGNGFSRFGFGNGNGGTATGGGIFLAGGTVTLDEVRLLRNSATGGSAVFGSGRALGPRRRGGAVRSR